MRRENCPLTVAKSPPVQPSRLVNRNGTSRKFFAGKYADFPGRLPNCSGHIGHRGYEQRCIAEHVGLHDNGNDQSPAPKKTCSRRLVSARSNSSPKHRLVEHPNMLLARHYNEATRTHCDGISSTARPANARPTRRAVWIFPPLADIISQAARGRRTAHQTQRITHVKNPPTC